MWALTKWVNSKNIHWLLTIMWFHCRYSNKNIWWGQQTSPFPMWYIGSAAHINLTCIVHNTLDQGCPRNGPRAQIWANDQIFLGLLGLKFLHWIWAFGPLTIQVLTTILMYCVFCITLPSKFWVQYRYNVHL